MSDHRQGEGWWLASDGKWYPPHRPPGKPLAPPPIPEGYTPTGPAEEPTGIRRIKWGIPVWLWAVLGVLALVFGLAGVTGNLNFDEPVRSLDDQHYSVHAACADFTRDRLRAPSTADFPEYDDR